MLLGNRLGVQKMRSLQHYVHQTEHHCKRAFAQTCAMLQPGVLCAGLAERAGQSQGAEQKQQELTSAEKVEVSSPKASMLPASCAALKGSSARATAAPCTTLQYQACAQPHTGR